LQKFFDDIGVNAASDVVTILISSKMKAASMGVFTQAEFKEGFTQMGISTVDDLKRKLPQLYQDLKNPEEFKKMYKFVYDFARDKTYKNLQVEIALDLWDLLLSTRCRFLSDWIDFIKTEKKD